MLDDPELKPVAAAMIAQIQHLENELRRIGVLSPVAEVDTTAQKLWALIETIYAAKGKEELAKATRLKRFAKRYLEPILYF